MKKFVSLVLFLFVIFCFNSSVAFSECRSTTHSSQTLAQTDLTPLDILILDLKDVKRLIEEGDNKTAITILKSSLGEVRKVKEFDKNTKKITEKRIKRGISLLKKNKNDEALAIVQSGIDELISAGLADPSDFESNF